MTAAVGDTLAPDALAALPAGAVIALTGRRYGPPMILQRSPGRGWANTVQDPYSTDDVVAFATDPAEGGPATVVLLMLPDQLPLPARVVKAEALREAQEAWGGNWGKEGRDVMFNVSGDDLTPQGRVGKWLENRADRIEAGESS